jgi:penicillin G amidase
MRYLTFLASLASLCGLLWLLNTSLTIKGNTLPPIGAFFNPFSGFWQNAEPAMTPTHSDIRINSLKKEVSVVFDDLAIPHIFAEELDDALRVQGYLTARDRLFQMDISSRKSLGRLSEIIGPKTIEIDRQAHHKGLPLGVERALAATKRSPESMAKLNAYIEGVNAYIGQLAPADYPVEYKLLNTAPTLWDAEKTLAIIEGMAESLVAQNNDICNSKNLTALGQETYDVLFPRYNPDQTPIVTDEGQWKEIGNKSDKIDKKNSTGTPKTDKTLGHTIPNEWNEQESQFPYEVRSGSNNWAVGGSRTTTGKPMLANDPHLTLTLPSIWYQVQIHTAEQNAYGVSLPGVPGIVIGFNEHIAWGMTNVSHDVGDFYRVTWLNETKTLYQLPDGEQAKTDVKVAKIFVKGQILPVLDTLRTTVWGPVLSTDTSLAEANLAYQWLPQLEPSPELIMEFLNLNKAKNYLEYRSAIQHFDVPAQNFVFASRSGDIGITAQGKFPIRPSTHAEFVQDGATVGQVWNEYIPQEQIPYQKNPACGFVYSANQHTTSAAYPFPYYGYFDDYRGRYIHKRLTAMDKMNMDSMAQLQLDPHTQLVDDALPLLISALDTNSINPAQLLIISELRSWNGNFDRSSKMGIFFDLWHRAFSKAAFDEFEDCVMPDTWVLYDLLKRKPNHAIFDKKDTPEIENGTQLCRSAFDEAVIAFAANQVLPNQNTWGTYSDNAVVHIARIPAFMKKIVTDGHPNAPNANKKGHGPSWRMLVDLQDSIRAMAVYPGGQSGNPGSPHYDDMLAHWADGKYYECLFLKTPTETNARIHSTLKCTK